MLRKSTQNKHRNAEDDRLQGFRTFKTTPKTQKTFRRYRISYFFIFLGKAQKTPGILLPGML